MPETMTIPAAMDTNPAALAEQLVACLADSLEAMAFITLMPVDTAALPPAPPELVRLNIVVCGALRGVVEIAAPLALGGQLIANVVEPGTPIADQAAVNADAMRELMNVVCGCFLRRLTPIGCDMQLPSLKPMHAEQWEKFLSTPGATVVDAEGTLIAVRATLVAAR